VDKSNNERVLPLVIMALALRL